MDDVGAYINSGILELYVLQQASATESAEVESMAARYPAIRAELHEISNALETYAKVHAVPPDVTLKPFILATIDFQERIKNGEPLSFPPLLTESSTIADYAEWLGREGIDLPADFTEIHAKIIGYTPQVVTAVVWLKTGSPVEVHDNIYEKFLIIEGACDIFIDDEVHSLVAGDVLSIPLYKKHYVKVTSPFACKVILQRVAA